MSYNTALLQSILCDDHVQHFFFLILRPCKNILKINMKIYTFFMLLYHAYSVWAILKEYLFSKYTSRVWLYL